MLPFMCKDVVSDPPTVLLIVNPNDDSVRPSNCFTVNIENVEPTKGWLERLGKPSINVCFMHSFGKCHGSADRDPSTCHHVHIKRDVLDELRKCYTNPPRRHFCKTVHAQLSSNVKDIISSCRGKEVKMWYLSYKISDVVPTSGLLQCEAAYRLWLFDTTQDRKNEDVKVFLCDNYALFGSCPNGEECLGIHAPFNKAKIIESSIADVLRKLTPPNSLFSNSPCTSSGGPTQSGSELHAVSRE
ncbi:hypothetical protein ADEAN_000391700 [Angomonas deanei]|uniref:C3H1-type domain-containing protein n=1 Tax=Angomonas deanei TaxID=59799 RepID=A0A7G2CAH5_9TRYP|nr:hypothetical protein ADEAN_000391700 [Angomonas deanei]